MAKKQSIASTLKSLRKLAASDDWSTREGAGFDLRNLIEEEFDAAMRLSESWVSDPSDRVRRAACLGCMQRKGHTDSRRVRSILRRLEKLMSDDSIYVRKCCGPFVVGYLGYTYPTLTLPWLAKQARKADLNVRANVAKAFTQALGRRHPVEGLAILKALAEDERPRVRSAVVSALRNMVRVKSISTATVRKQFPEISKLIRSR